MRVLCDADEKDDMAKEDSDKLAHTIAQLESLRKLGKIMNHHLLCFSLENGGVIVFFLHLLQMDGLMIRT